jgi:hypothetical protein
MRTWRLQGLIENQFSAQKSRDMPGFFISNLELASVEALFLN